MVAPLDGVRVVEMGGWMAAPGAAAMLADMGADVVKVEPPRGDPMRGATRQPQVPPGSPAVDASFHLDNRGKRGVAIAVNQPEGADLVRRLAAGADVFINNLMASRQQRFGLDPDSLLALNPRLVHASMTGYGLAGPDAERAGYDLTAFFARGGIIHMSTEPDSMVPRLRPAQGDHTAALALVASILAALRLVEATGTGQVVDANLLATAAWTMSTDLSGTLVDGQNPPLLGRRVRAHALHGGFRCADGRWVLLFMPEPTWWPRFCAVVERPEWVEDPRMQTVQTRREHMSEITDLMDEVFATRPLAEWGRRLDDAGLIWGPAVTVTELAADPQAEALGLYPEIGHPSAGPFRTVAAPIRIRDADIHPRGPGPDVGEHTAEVLAELGLTADEVRALADAGVVGVPERAAHRSP